MAVIRPWGNVNWLMPRIGAREWSSACCTSFEPRCTAVSEWVSSNIRGGKHFVLRIDDPPNRFTDEIRTRTDYHQGKIFSALGKDVHLHISGLLDSPSLIHQFVRELDLVSGSLVLDITAMPKRFFLFIVSRLLASKNLRDLVICYTRAEGYKEGLLTEDAEPPSALPGFARVSSDGGDTTMVVSVGYMAFNLTDLLEQARGRQLKFLFPFPPGSPGFRRNWDLLRKLIPNISIQTDIQRIHAIDMFAAMEWIDGLARDSSAPIDMIPLGPKPHALAMALAARKIGDNAELLYSQPRVYHPDYSHGIYMDQAGKAEVVAYCLRREYIDYV
ncbi:hypothetical protein [Silvimonas sp.]|uniref:hypothetical protein n=1 Tax=Silvimonas sp. TaxID=2650811 RepID=UPI0028506330|nr:hypothetical protein [Silvimonas sp.]MDR3427366.1 hypothetical protein [Silvimonas sp.]